MSGVIQKLVRKIKRLLFVGVFGVLTVGFLFFEIAVLRNSRPNGVVLGIKNDIDNKIVISDAESETQKTMSSNVIGEDARPIIIRKYLEKYKSPLVPYSDLIYQLSKDYNFEYYWIVAIAQQESNLCKKAPEDSHNCWGYGIHKKGTLKFDNYELALRSYAEYLKREYFDKGLNTPELIMKKYCPSSNGSWAAGVNQFINELQEGNI